MIIQAVCADQDTAIAPGVYAMSNREYHASLGVSKSDLDLIHKSPLHYWKKKAGFCEESSTEAMAFGTLVHTFVLEPEQVENQYIQQPDEIDLRNKAGKEWKAAQDASKSIAKKSDWATATAMRDAVMAHPIAARLFDGGRRELSIFWKHETADILCKCRPDNLTEDGILVDLKTAIDASPEAMMKAAWNFRYHVQAAWYLDGAASLLAPRAFVFVAVEKTPPFAVGVYMADDDLLKRGKKDYLRDLRAYSDCTRQQAWPGYTDAEIYPLSVPTWAK